MEQRVSDALREAFKPEFLNRVDETIIFNSLGREEIKSIVEIQLKRLRQNLANRKMALGDHRAGQSLARRQGLRSGLRRAPAQTHDSAIDSGPAGG